MRRGCLGILAILAGAGIIAALWLWTLRRAENRDPGPEARAVLDIRAQDGAALVTVTATTVSGENLPHTLDMELLDRLPGTAGHRVTYTDAHDGRGRPLAIHAPTPQEQSAGEVVAIRAITTDGDRVSVTYRVMPSREGLLAPVGRLSGIRVIDYGSRTSRSVGAVPGPTGRARSPPVTATARCSRPARTRAG